MKKPRGGGGSCKVRVPKVVTAASVLHLDVDRLLEVALHVLEHVFPQLTQLRVAVQVEVEETVTHAGVQQVLALRGIFGSQEVEVDSLQGLGNDDGLAVRHG